MATNFSSVITFRTIIFLCPRSVHRAFCKNGSLALHHVILQTRYVAWNRQGLARWFINLSLFMHLRYFWNIDHRWKAVVLVVNMGLLLKYGPIRVLFLTELRIADHYLRPLSGSYINIQQPWRVSGHSLTERSSRRSIFIYIINSHGHGQLLSPRRTKFNSNCKAWIVILARDWLIRS